MKHHRIHSLYLFLFLSVLACGAMAQSQAYDIVPMYGIYKGPDLDRIKHKSAIGIDFDYHLSGKWVLTAGFVQGRFRYVDEIRTFLHLQLEDGPDATNAEGFDYHLYVLSSYALILRQRFSLNAGAGVGAFSRTFKYPYAGPSSATSAEVFVAEQSFSRVEIPAKVEANYMLSKCVGIGLKAGLFWVPNQGLVGLHTGPRLLLRLGR